MEDCNSWAMVIERAYNDEIGLSQLDPDITQECHSLLIKYLLDHLPTENPSVHSYIRWKIEKGGRPIKISDFINKLMSAAWNLQMANDVIRICGFKIVTNNHKRSNEDRDSERNSSSKRGRHHDTHESSKGAYGKSEKAVTFKDKGKLKPPTCNGCGRTHHGECRMNTHPNYNNSGLPWHESESGLAYFARGQNVLPYDPPYLKPTDTWIEHKSTDFKVKENSSPKFKFRSSREKGGSDRGNPLSALNNKNTRKVLMRPIFYIIITP